MQCDVSDEALRAFAPLVSLKELDLSFSGVSVAGCLEIARLTGVTRLSLESCARVDDRGLANLLAQSQGVGLQRLTHVNLLGCPVGDRAMVDVARLRDLTDLSLSSAEITNRGASVRAFHECIPSSAFQRGAPPHSPPDEGACGTHPGQQRPLWLPSTCCPIACAKCASLCLVAEPGH
jgi:hypothetical protein